MIEEVDGFAPQISRLVSMMNYTRHTTEGAIRGLTVEELDFHLDDQSNSIGMLLQHMVSVERAFQIMTFEQRELTDAEWDELGIAIELGDRAKDKICGRDLDYYWSEMSLSREYTLQELQKRDDDWLDVITPYGWNEKANHYFKWFHVMEDELSHRGQILLIRKRILV